MLLQSDVLKMDSKRSVVIVALHIKGFRRKCCYNVIMKFLKTGRKMYHNRTGLKVVRI
jgi:hypothetical protein